MREYRLGGSVLRPTPGFGAEMRRFSYVVAAVAEEYGRRRRGKDVYAGLEANKGLNARREAIVMFLEVERNI